MKNAIRSIEFLLIITYFPPYRLLIFKQLHVINRNSIAFFNPRQSIYHLYDLRWIFFLCLYSHKKGVNLNNRYFHHGSKQFFTHRGYLKQTFFRDKKTYFRSDKLIDLITQLRISKQVPVARRIFCRSYHQLLYNTDLLLDNISH